MQDSIMLPYEIINFTKSLQDKLYIHVQPTHIMLMLFPTFKLELIMYMFLHILVPEQLGRRKWFRCYQLTWIMKLPRSGVLNKRITYLE